MATPDERAWRVWERMAEFYGSRFAENYGDAPTKSWIDAIDLLTDAQITFGLKYVRLTTPDHPPTLGRFQRCCLDTPESHKRIPESIQERLTAYAARKGVYMRSQGTPIFIYREWEDSTKPKNMQHCAECVGVIFELPDGTRTHSFSAAEMIAESESRMMLL